MRPLGRFALILSLAMLATCVDKPGQVALDWVEAGAAAFIGAAIVWGILEAFLAADAAWTDGAGAQGGGS